MWTNAVRKGRFGGSKKTNDDEFVAKLVSQLARCPERDRKSCWYVARPEDTKKGAKESGGAGKQRSVVEL